MFFGCYGRLVIPPKIQFFFCLDPPPPPPPLHLSTCRHPTENLSLLGLWILSPICTDLCGVGGTISRNVSLYIFKHFVFFIATKRSDLHRSIWRHSGLTGSALDSGSKGLGSNHGKGHCVLC